MPLVEAGVEGFESCFEDLEDPRTGNAGLHDLLEMLFIALSASTVTIVPLRHSIFNNLGTAVISFDLASVAICASTRR